jgi:tetrahydromethanopterin S-methyltransferase subunit A
MLVKQEVRVKKKKKKKQVLLIWGKKKTENLSVQKLMAEIISNEK